MSDFISVNAKYYKHTQVDGETGHVNRKFKKNKNARDDLTHLNFGTADIKADYEKIKKSFEERKGKAFQKNANTLVDCVVAFSRERMREIKEEHPDDWQNIIEKYLKQYMSDVYNKFGLYPIGFNFHADEGHIDPDTGQWFENYHAHVAFFNYDPSTKKAPLRAMKKNDWSELQDIAGNAFRPLKFRRGVKKDDKKKHLEKEDYVKQKQEKKAEVLEEKLKQLEARERELKNKISELKEFGKSIVNWLNNRLKKIPSETEKWLAAKRGASLSMTDDEFKKFVEKEIKKAEKKAKTRDLSRAYGIERRKIFKP